MSKPEIVIPNFQGYHNSNPNTKIQLDKSKSYQDLSTICIVPAIAGIPPKIVQSWNGLLKPMNQKFYMIMAENMEVGIAYSETIEMILAHPELSKFKYILALETDNAPPADGLLKLYESIENYDAVGGLYYTKGEIGQPMCYGNVTQFPVNFIPFYPQQDIQPCRGLGMGFTLFRMSIFKDKNFPRPFFKTLQSYETGVGVKSYTQDLFFFEQAGKLGYKFACDARVKVGHYDYENNFMY